MKKINGQVHIGRVCCSHTNDYINIEIRDEAARLPLVKAQVSFAEFSQALCGAPQKCSVEFNDSDKIGKKREHKTVPIEVPDDVYQLSDADLKKCVALHEVDGWIGNAADLKNPNRHGDGKCNDVGFERWV